MALISKSIWQRFLLLPGKDFLSFIRLIFFTSNVPDPVFSTRVAPSKLFGRFLCTLTSFVLFALFSVIFLHRSTRVSAKQTKGLLHRLPPASRKRCRKELCSSPSYEWVMKLKCRSSLCSLVRSRFLGGVLRRLSDYR